MSDMNGNEQYENGNWLADKAETQAEGLAANAFATLAVAYEQRTANLIAAFQAIENVDGDPTYMAVHEDDGKNLAHEIRDRLGLDQP